MSQNRNVVESSIVSEGLVFVRVRTISMEKTSACGEGRDASSVVDLTRDFV